MLGRITVILAFVIVGTLSAGDLRAADRPSEVSSAEKQDSTKEKVKRATDTAAEKMERAAETASKEVSDSWITLKTKLSLFADERVSGKDVHVTTQQRVILLTGKVGTEEARVAAEEIASKIEGAKKVENQLVVAPRAAQKTVDRKDDQIASDVEGRIKQDPSLKAADITVHANKGIVTLTGNAPSLTTSVRASEVAHRVPGVRAVHNELNVNEQQG